ncbi:MAG TPA: site-specific DNA-methyltransferase, partial [Polyangiaceae bacterium]
MNRLFHGDALHLDALVEHGSVTLAYLDPPFNVGTTFGARTKKGEARATGPKAYEDRWASVEAFV